MSSNINDLHPYVKFLANKFLEECKKQNLNVVIYFTFRTIEQQNELYAQGRTKPGKIVTNAKGCQSYHNYGLAFDAAPLVSGEIDWDNEALFSKMGKIGESVGLEWGGRWKSFKDTPHLQWSGGLEISDLLRGKKPVAHTRFNNNQTNIQKNQTPSTIITLGFSDAKQFQKVMGLAVDGIVGDKTKAAISDITKNPLCKKGSSGFAVRYIQFKVGSNITGTFDDSTLNKVKTWQSQKNLSSDGIVGDMTWKSFLAK